MLNILFHFFFSISLLPFLSILKPITFLKFPSNFVISLVVISSLINPSFFNTETKLNTSSLNPDELKINNNDNVKLDLPPIGSFYSSELNITTNGDYYDGYNLFVLDKQNVITHLQEIHLIVIDMEGNLISSMYLGSAQALVFSVAKFINSTTIVVGGIIRPFLWNFFENTTYELNFSENHDIEYISATNTYLTLIRDEIVIEGYKYAYDKIVEFTALGLPIWSVSTKDFIPYTQWCPFQDMLGDARSITHSNSLFYNPDDDTILLSCRNMNTIYKLNHTSKELIWSLGEHGEFDLYDIHGNQKDSLWYHSHSFEYFDDNKIILFDNDFHNQTNPNSRNTRIVEIEIDEEKKMANETWTYVAPEQYYTNIWGDADKLPNGDRLGTFGSMTHSFTSKNAKVLEINEEKEIVWKLDFVHNDVYTYGIYRFERFTPYPGLENIEQVYGNSIENTTIQLETWSGYRTRTDLQGYYRLYLNDSLKDEGTHTFRSYWRKSPLELNLGVLFEGYHNLTIVLEDDVGHQVIENIDVWIKPFYVLRTGFSEIELGQTDSILRWEGKAETPLQMNLTINDVPYNSTTWFSSNVSLDLNSLGLGVHKIEFLLYNSTEPVYNETFYANVYPAAPPIIVSEFSELSISWGETPLIYWAVFDNTPKNWEIWVNDTLTTASMWIIKEFELNWRIPLLEEGVYNITLILYDRAGFSSTSSVLLTIETPSPPMILYISTEQEYQFGVGNITVSWLIHGGNLWYLWVDEVLITQGLVQRKLFTYTTNIWDVLIWEPGQHNLTLQVKDANQYSTISSVLITVWLNKADPYADAVIPGLSDVYLDGDYALGAPDNISCKLIETYTHGYITLDMGEQEEILNQNGDDFWIYTNGGEYQIWIGNDLESPFTYLGNATGTASFNVGSTSLNSVRYVKIQFTEGAFLDIDAVEAIYYNIPKWDSTPPYIHPLFDFEIALSEKIVSIYWNAFDENPFNYTIEVDGAIFQAGFWNGGLINCSIPLNRIGKMVVTLILFDTYGNSAYSSVTITVNQNVLMLVLDIILPSFIAVAGITIFTKKRLKLKKTMNR